MSDKAKAKRVLVLRAEKGDSYGDRYAHINGFVSHANAAESCGFEGQRYDGDGDILEIQISSQIGSLSGTDNARKMYGMEVGYSANNKVTLWEAQKAIKALAPINRKLDKMYATEGNAASFGQWINRVARAVGAVSVIIANDERKRQTDNAWRAHDLGSAVFAIDCMESELADWAYPEAVREAA